jgi:Chaperone of endosialidase
VRGNSTNGIGVYGVSTNSFAVYFQGNVHVLGTVTQGSDVRLKQNISTLGYGLAEVLRLRPVTWRWKEHPETGQQLGLVAQDVEPVLPEPISTYKDPEQTKGLNYTGLLPVLVKAMQEQQAQIERQSRQLKTQQTRIERQQREIGTLRQAVKALKSSIHNHHRK